MASNGVGRLDHLVVLAPDLDDAMQDWKDHTGVSAVPGGAHDGQGTRNALVGLDDGRYVELMAPNPAEPATPAAREIAALPAPILVTYAVACPDLDALAAHLEGTGLALDVVSMSRTAPNGDHLRFRYAPLRGHSFGPLAPFFLEWGDTPHPSSVLPVGCRLRGLTLGHPDAGGLEALLRRVGVDAVAVVESEVGELTAVLQAPAGEVVLRSAPTLFGGA